MKNVSLKIDDSIFIETEKILSKIKNPRNRYINETIEYYNKLQRRILLEKKLKVESDLVNKDSMSVLKNLRRFIMLTKQYEIWITDLNPQIGKEPGKTRPVVIIQTNLLNTIPHPSTSGKCNEILIY